MEGQLEPPYKLITRDWLILSRADVSKKTENLNKNWKQGYERIEV